jgi:uncharacterized lipoprotein YehR (DUF1307 family)
MKKMRKLSIMIAVCLVTVLTLTACGSQADKDYVAWTEKYEDMETKNSDYMAKCQEAGDIAAYSAAVGEFKSYVETAKSELEKIDDSKLGSANKETYDKSLAQLNENLSAIQQMEEQVVE